MLDVKNSWWGTSVNKSIQMVNNLVHLQRSKKKGREETLGRGEKVICFPWCLSLHNPVSTTNVSYVRSQSASCDENSDKTQHFGFVQGLLPQPKDAWTSATSSASFPSSSAAEVRGGVKHGVRVWIQRGGEAQVRRCFYADELLSSFCFWQEPKEWLVELQKLQGENKQQFQVIPKQPHQLSVRVCIQQSWAVSGGGVGQGCCRSSAECLFQMRWERAQLLLWQSVVTISRSISIWLSNQCHQYQLKRNRMDSGVDSWLGF